MKKGFAMATVLLLISVIVVAGFFVSQLGDIGKIFAAKQYADEAAFQAAAAGVAQTLSSLKADREFKATVIGTLSGTGATFTVTFDATDAAARGIPWSTNNLSSYKKVTDYYGNTIPAQSAEIISAGQYGEIKRYRVQLIEGSGEKFTMCSAWSY